MASEYNFQQKKQNLAQALRMKAKRFDSKVVRFRNEEGKRVQEVVKVYHPAQYDPAHIKKICKLSFEECYLIGLYLRPKLPTLPPVVTNPV